MVTLQNTSRCNLQCSICQRQFFPAQPIIDMAPESITRIAHELFPYIKFLQLSVMGEPLLVSNVGVIIELAKRYGTKLHVTTNGTQLFRKELVSNLLPVLSCLSVSFDAAVKRTYESIRVGARYEETIRAIRTFDRLRRDIPPNIRPTLTMVYILMRRNIEELPDAVALAKKLGFDHLHTAHLLVFDPSLEGESLVHYKELANRFFSLTEEKAAEVGIGLTLPPRYNLEGTVESREQGRSSSSGNQDIKYTCKLPWYASWISNGLDVIPCCGPHPERPVMGNLKHQSFEEVWNGPAYRKLRASFRDNNPPNFCRQCYLLEETVPDDEKSIRFY